MTKLDLLSSQAPSLTQKDDLDVKEVFMIVVSPAEEDEYAEDAW